jgi:DNA-directed RNA polymerase specialized sigma24 family protein
MSRPDPDPDDRQLEALVASAALGDQDAWTRLWAVVEPRLSAVVRKPRFLGALSGSDDEQRNIVLEVMARLCADDYRRLRLYVDKRGDHPDMQFMAWLIVVAKRVAIDYMRGHDQYLSHRHKRNPGSAAGAWVAMDTLPASSQLGDRPPMTERGTALELMSYAGHTLPEDQRRALKMWVQDDGYERIATELGLADASAAERLVRAALSRLRRHFRDDEPPGAA